MADQPSSLFVRMHRALARTAHALGRTMDAVRGKRLDDAFFEELEETLIMSDCGVAAATQVVQELRAKTIEQREYDPDEVRQMLAQIIADKLTIRPMPSFDELHVLLFVGVNGVGKTTSIGKIANRYVQQGKRVVIAAGDTFRAAAAEQLAVWNQRAGAELVQHQPGADPAAVLYDAIAAARARKADVVLCDTAGRLHNQQHLMAELGKVARIAQREGVPRLTLMVIDGVTGQNALAQAQAFLQTCAVDGVIITKLDGTARGGVALAVAQQLGLPVWYVGIGEGLEDLQPFDAMAYARGMLGM